MGRTRSFRGPSGRYATTRSTRSFAFRWRAIFDRGLRLLAQPDREQARRSGPGVRRRSLVHTFVLMYGSYCRVIRYAEACAGVRRVATGNDRNRSVAVSLRIFSSDAPKLRPTTRFGRAQEIRTGSEKPVDAPREWQ
jgi:hypothetical protein